MGLLFSAAFCCLSGPVTCTAAPPLCIGGGDWLYAAVVALEAGEGMGARVLRLAHATPAARTVVRVFVAAPSSSPRPWVGAAPSPCRRPALGHWADFSPRGVSCEAWGVFLPAPKGNSRTPGPFSPREKIGRAAPRLRGADPPARVVCPVARRCRLACSPCLSRRTCSPPRRT